MTNEELVEQIQQGINVQGNLTTLYEQNQRFIYKMAKPFMKYADPDDILQEAYLGFHDAVFAYKPGDAVFISYLPYRIRKHCIKYLEDTSNTKRIPSSRLNEIRKYQHFFHQFRNEHGTDPDDKTIMDALGLSQVKLDRIRQTIYEQNCISIHEPVAGTEDAALEDLLEDGTDIAANVEEQMMQEYTRKVLDEAIAGLPSNQAEVITSRYWNDESQVQVAEKMECSSAWVSQLEKKALNRLKAVHSVERLLEQYGYDSQLAYRRPERLAIKRIRIEEKLKRYEDKLDDIFSEIMEGCPIDI